MMSKTNEKELAVNLRKKGLSYSEILERVDVARSTLSLWLREVKLSKKQRQRLTAKKLASMLRGAKAKHEKRVLDSSAICQQASAEIGRISNRELLLVGSALYWAEGSKQKEHNVSQGVVFANSDPNMVKFFLWFIKSILGVGDENVKFELYIHHSGNLPKAKNYWSQELNQSKGKFATVYFKNNKVNTKRKNILDNYHGLIRIRILRSTNLNRRITGWIQGIIKHCGVV